MNLQELICTNTTTYAAENDSRLETGEHVRPSMHAPRTYANTRSALALARAVLSVTRILAATATFLRVICCIVPPEQRAECPASCFVNATALLPVLAKHS
jgi:hypothetical protein